MPDHSLLNWSLIVQCDMKIYSEGDGSNSSSTKFDVKNIPDDFMLNQDTINDIISLYLNLKVVLETKLILITYMMIGVILFKSLCITI
jgi:hypothetical protein